MKTIPTLHQLVSGFVHLLYPHLCVACGADLLSRGYCFCLRCKSKLSPTEMHESQENEFTERLWGRLKIESGTAAYYFSQQSPVRMAIHHLKYKNKPEIGWMIGRELGQKLHKSNLFRSVEGIVPVPLHPQKERARGYNQSAAFGRGLSEAMGVPLFEKALVREAHTETQTKKKRMERFQNVGEAFAVANQDLLQNKHLLLVDDVLTTGATLELCGQAILSMPGTKLSCATIAMATRD